MTNLILNGKLIYKVDEIADNYNEAELVKAFKTGDLGKWLDQKSEEDILQSVREIDEKSKNLASELTKALGLDPQLCSKAEKNAKAEQEAIAKRKEEEARKAKEEEERKAKEEEERKAKEEKERQEKKSAFKDVRAIIEDALRPLEVNFTFYMGSIPPEAMEEVCNNLTIPEPYGNIVAIHSGGPYGCMVITQKGVYFTDFDQLRAFYVAWGQNTSFEKGLADYKIVVGNRNVSLGNLNKAAQEVLVDALRMIDKKLAHCGTSCQGNNPLKQLIVEEFSKISSDRVYVEESIPWSMRHYAIANMDVKEDIVILVDDTARARDGKAGLVITNESIYCKFFRDSRSTDKFIWGTMSMIKMNDYGWITIDGKDIGPYYVESETRKMIGNAIIKINDFAKTGGHT